MKTAEDDLLSENAPESADPSPKRTKQLNLEEQTRRGHMLQSRKQGEIYSWHSVIFCLFIPKCLTNMERTISVKEQDLAISPHFIIVD